MNRQILAKTMFSVQIWSVWWGSEKANRRCYRENHVIRLLANWEEHVESPEYLVWTKIKKKSALKLFFLPFFATLRKFSMPAMSPCMNSPQMMNQFEQNLKGPSQSYKKLFESTPFLIIPFENITVFFCPKLWDSTELENLFIIRVVHFSVCVIYNRKC